MPKKNDRNMQDFSKYDAMTSEELVQVLRLDSEAPEGNALDIDTLLYITGVLAEREKINNNTGKTAQEAWISFQQNYLPSEDECSECTEETKPVKSRNPWVRRAIAAAAVVVLMVAVPLTAKAFNWQKIVDTVAKWAKETFSFVREDQPEVNEPSPANVKQYESLQQALEATDQESKMIPTWIPEGYVIDDIIVEENPVQRNYVAMYTRDDQILNICIRSYGDNDPERVESSENLIEIYDVGGIQYHIFKNYDQLRAVWITDSYECYISGEITIEETKRMIDSIPKG